MLIRCYGARGSIPVSGKDYLVYGGNTTCMEVRTSDDKIIIIDAGTGIRELGNRLFTEGRNIYHLLFTHAHWDHLMGFPFFKPIYPERTKISIYGCPFAQKSVKHIISGSMQPPNFPIKFEDAHADFTYYETCDKPFSIGSMDVEAILLSHPNQGIGYKFSEEGKTFVFLTDNELQYTHPGGLKFGDYLEFSANADLLIHDAEFTDDEYALTSSWGHSTYTDALRLAIEANVAQFGLFHHNQGRTDIELDQLVKHCNEIVASKNSSLRCFAMAQGMEIEL